MIGVAEVTVCGMTCGVGHVVTDSLATVAGIRLDMPPRAICWPAATRANAGEAGIVSPRATPLWAN